MTTGAVVADMQFVTLEEDQEAAIQLLQESVDSDAFTKVGHLRPRAWAASS